MIRKPCKREFSDREIKISLIVPCFNVEQYLPRCLNSLVNQTLKEIEIVCINDGSSDRCIDILREYESRFPGKVIVVDKKNEGVWKGRQDGIAQARGRYIGFVDGDDYVELDYCQALYECVVENDASIAVCGFYREDVDSGAILSTEMARKQDSFNVAACPERLLELNGALWNKLFDASILKRVPDLENAPQILEDMMMQLLVFLESREVAYCGRALVHYTVRKDSTMSTIKSDQIALTYKAMLEVKNVYDCHASARFQYLIDAVAFLHLGISLMFRISCDAHSDLKSALVQNEQFLDENFSSWRSSKVISLRNAVRYRGAFLKLFVVKLVYSLHMMPAFLSTYRSMISRGIDIKW